MDLFRYMARARKRVMGVATERARVRSDAHRTCSVWAAQESFPSSPRGDALLVPTNVLELWFRKFDDKFRRDPDFLLRAPPAPL